MTNTSRMQSASRYGTSNITAIAPIAYLDRKLNDYSELIGIELPNGQKFFLRKISDRELDFFNFYRYDDQLDPIEQYVEVNKETLSALLSELFGQCERVILYDEKQWKLLNRTLGISLPREKLEFLRPMLPFGYSIRKNLDLLLDSAKKYISRAEQFLALYRALKEEKDE